METKEKTKQIIASTLGELLDCNQDEGDSITERIIENLEGELIGFSKEQEGILSFDLRGDELEIIESIKTHIPSIREDIWSWLCYLQGEIEELKEKNEPLQMKTWECVKCEEDEDEEMRFQATKTAQGFIPCCPKCHKDYRVFEVKDKKTGIRS